MKKQNKDKTPVINRKEFIEFYLKRDYNENMFDKDGNINPKYNSFKKTGILSKIVEEHREELFEKYGDWIKKYRPNVFDEFQKMIDCHNKNLGFTAYQCPKCGDFIFVGNTCKSRSCTSCGYKYKLERVENIIQTAYNCNHRQIVFTIPKEFRKYFFLNLKRIDILFDAVNKTIYSLLNETYKKKRNKKKKLYKKLEKFMPGFFAFLHTFGRDLKFNPHIHVLIAEMKISDKSIKKWDYFNFDALSKRFQKILTDLMLENIPEFTSSDARKSYLNHKNGFYVYAEKKKFKNLKSGIEYVCRYCGRMPISENRIKSYDGENVTFWYNAHEDEEYHEITVSAVDFLKMLIEHIIPKNFKTIRYYGFYRKKPKQHDQIKKLIDDVKKPFRKMLLKYEMSITKSFNRNPINCPHCGIRMNLFAFVT